MKNAATTVLLADDETDFVRLVAQRLQIRGIEVRAASSGREALSILNSTEIEIVVLDLHMPGMDGFKTLEAIIASKPRAKVILLTADSSVKNAMQGMRLGAYDYLTKPIETDLLLMKIQQACGFMGESEQV